MQGGSSSYSATKNATSEVVSIDEDVVYDIGTANSIDLAISQTILAKR